MKMEVEKNSSKIDFNPTFTIGIVGRCRVETIYEIKDFFEMLEGFELIYVKTTKRKKLWIMEEGDDR